MIYKKKNIKIKKPKINLAFFFENFGSWEGEKNYLVCLITAIDKYYDENYSIKIISSNKILNELKKLKLKNIELINSLFFTEKNLLNYLRKFSSRLFKQYDPTLYFLIKKHDINIVSHYKPLNYCKTICWLPDFQHTNLPKNFDTKEITRRNILYDDIIKNSSLVLLSSQTSAIDLKRFSKKKVKFKILNFVPHINFKDLKIKRIGKYNLNNYLIIPNQFWKHKNHLILVKALNRLKNKKFNLKLVLTGDSSSQKNKDVFNKFLNEIKSKKLENFFLYLGKVPYSTLVKLIYDSKALINPSFFEGWSTSVEEAKILHKKIILSKIKVHIEQKPKYSYFFHPNNDLRLSNIIYKIGREKKLKFSINHLKKNYEIERFKFAKNYFKIIKNI
jgi:glycosyltransferase involved in cell wall biosynthesis